METHSTGGDLFGNMIADKDRMILNALLDELTDFVRENDKERCFPKKAWTRESTRNFIHYHLNHGTLLIVRSDDVVVGLATWFRWRKDEIPALSPEEIFQNPPPYRADGEIIYLSDVVATEAGAFNAMMKAFAKKNPDYADLELWGSRLSKKTGVTRPVKYTRRLVDLGRK